MNKNYCAVCGAEDGKPHGDQVCLACGFEEPCQGEDQEVPTVNDDTAWAELEKKHNTGCEWVASRAYRI